MEKNDIIFKINSIKGLLLKKLELFMELLKEN